MNRNKKTNTIFLVLIAIVIGGALMYAAVRFTPLGNTVKTDGFQLQNNTKVIEKGSLATSIDKVYDAVVLIQGYKNNELASTGTGFIYKKEGNDAYILTNHHVLSDMDKIEIVSSTDEKLEGKVLGQDQYLDLGVVKVDGKNLKTVAKFADSTKMNVGDIVFTIGSPMGYDYRGTVTSGILSGKDRLVTVSTDNSSNGDWVMKVLQTDAAINPGNSGGPLLNANGEVIGINTLKLVKEEIEGMGFAIPIEYASAHLEELEKGKEIEWPVLGISMINANDKMAAYKNNIKLDENITSGVIVVDVSKDSSAAKADVKVGDIVTKINGEEVKDIAYLRYELYKHKTGDTIELTVKRDGKDVNIKVKLTK